MSLSAAVVRGMDHISTSTAWRAGDLGKALVVLLAVAFLCCVALHEGVGLPIFSASYAADGFCVANKGASPAVQSHALSFYANASLSLCMVVAVWVARRRRALSDEALAPVGKNAISLFGHGIGHLLIALKTDHSKSTSTIFEDMDAAQRVIAFLAFTPVWFGFMRDRQRSMKLALALAVAHNALQVWLLPTRFFFTHVLMAVLLNSALRKLPLPRESKSMFYDMEAWLVDVPILLMSFVEATACDAFLIRIGGHVWFDMVVPVGFGVYLAVLLICGHGQPAKLPRSPRSPRTPGAGPKEPNVSHVAHSQGGVARRLSATGLSWGLSCCATHAAQLTEAERA